MEMSNFRAESHVAQQRRRDKLRIQQHIEDYTNNLEQLSVHQGLNPDLIHLRNVKYGSISYDPSVFQTSEMLNFVTKNPQVLLSQNDALEVHQESGAAQPNRPADNFSFAKLSGDPQNCSSWKNNGSQQNCDWIVNYSSNSTGIESNQNPMFVGEGLPASLKVNNISAPPSCYGYQDVQSSSISSHQSSDKHYGEMNFSSSPFYQNTLQEVVTSATMGTQGLEMASLVQSNTGISGGTDSSELLLLPAYGDQSNPVSLNDSSAWMNRPVGGCQQWNSELSFLANKNVRDPANDSSNTQGLSLSLSSVPPAKTPESRFRERDDSEDLRSRTGVFNDVQNSKGARSDYLCSSSKPLITSRVFGNTRQSMMGTYTFTHPTTGPLGPFTGYATILKSSKYMKPTQQLLVEFCSIGGPKAIQTLEGCSEKISKEVRECDDAVHVAEAIVGGGKGGDSGASSSTFYGSNEISGEVGGRSNTTDCFRPEYQQKKAKLLYMQEEICRRYKQYHQQIQMVVSSFESVAGLSSATPYISVALKTVSKNFRCLKNAISEQLGHIKRALGEDMITGASRSKCETSSTSGFKLMEHSFQKHKTGGSNLAFFEPQPPVWRPQRGLPERAVSILRAWLFDHFLHPYPTDTDKHMLASQTGLTRNQVSNWFINARVRVWKPMVEEIHTLETKGGLPEANLNAGKAFGHSASDDPNDEQPTNGLRMSSTKHVECSAMGPASESVRDGSSQIFQNDDKPSRVEGQIRANMDESLMSFVPYRQSGLEIGGLGAVSLTLGLRQSAESAQQQQQLRQHFGGQMMHDFVG